MTDGTRAGGSLETGPETRDKLAEVAGRHGVRLLVAFGSRVSGRTHAASDLDLAMLLDTPEEVDVVWLHRADPLIAWHALRQPRLLYGESGDLARHQAYAWRRFVEYTPFFEREGEMVRWFHTPYLTAVHTVRSWKRQ